MTTNTPGSLPPWHSAISRISPGEIIVRGYPIEALMGGRSFAETIWLLWMGELPDAATATLVDAMLVSCVDHGTIPPSTQGTLNAAAVRAPLSTAIAAGILPITHVHGGAIEGAMKLFADVVAEYRTEQTDTQPLPVTATPALQEAAAAVIRDYKARGELLPGFGHPVHDVDPRTTRLFAMAREVGKAAIHLAAAEALTLVLARAKPLTLNIDGGMAAVLADLRVPRKLANAFFILSRAVGLVAHYHEETTREKPLRLKYPGSDYDGPARRDLPTE